MTLTNERPRRTGAAWPALAVAGLLAGSSGSAAAQEWQTTDCATSPLQIDGEARCQMIRRIIGSGAQGQHLGENFNVSGQRGAVSFLAAYYPPPPGGPNSTGNWATYSTQRSEEMIRVNAGASAAQFGAYRGFGHTGIVEYRKGQASCVGFDHGYPRGSSYEFFVRGEVCSQAAIGDGERLVRELLAALKIARSGEPMINALGATPTALSWR